jgi:DNA-binding NarL/FixJ family response regulator
MKTMKTRKDPVPHSTDGPPKAEAARSNARRSVLLVDDHPMLRAGLAGVINQQPDLRVCGEAASVDEALALLPRCSPDLVITDMSLPGRGGLDLIRELKLRQPDLPVLVITMQDETFHAERTLRAGARGYLMKEAGAEKMLEAIRQVLAGQVHVSERMSAKILDLFSGRRAHGSPIEKLTDREFEVFQLIGLGRTTRAIAEELGLSSKTVDVHRGHIKEKLALPDATSLVHHAIRWVETQSRAES